MRNGSPRTRTPCAGRHQKGSTLKYPRNTAPSGPVQQTVEPVTGGGTPRPPFVFAAREDDPGESGARFCWIRADRILRPILPRRRPSPRYRVTGWCSRTQHNPAAVMARWMPWWLRAQPQRVDGLVMQRRKFPKHSCAARPSRHPPKQANLDAFEPINAFPSSSRKGRHATPVPIDRHHNHNRNAAGATVTVPRSRLPQRGCRDPEGQRAQGVASVSSIRAATQSAPYRWSKPGTGDAPMRIGIILTSKGRYCARIGSARSTESVPS